MSIKEIAKNPKTNPLQIDGQKNDDPKANCLPGTCHLQCWCSFADAVGQFNGAMDYYVANQAKFC